MEQVSKSGLMGQNIKDNGKKVSKMGMEKRLVLNIIILFKGIG